MTRKDKETGKTIFLTQPIGSRKRGRSRRGWREVDEDDTRCREYKGFLDEPKTER